MEEKDVSILKRQISALQKENEDLKNENKRLKKENTDIVKFLKETTSYVKLDELIHNPGLEHIAAQIFKYLDPKSLGQCRAVSKGWKSLIDNDEYCIRLMILAAFEKQKQRGLKKKKAKYSKSLQIIITE